MSDKVFVDTNVLIYGHDVEAGAKHEVAKSRLEMLWESRRGALSAQVLQEFYVNVTRKIPKPISKSAARDIVRAYFPWHVPLGGPDAVVRASEIEERHKLSFWDALILVAANKAGASTVLSEDLNPGQIIDGVRVENPFASSR